MSDRQGWVEGQKIEENSWSERELNSVLNEQEKLRTLSDSSAQVVFRDASRLRLNPNSQAVIQRMRDDPLSRRKEAQISLVEGDFYALLAPESERSKLEVRLKNVDAKIDSGNFWVSQDADTAKFSNYDSAPVAIVSGGETMTLGRNEGAVVRSGEAPRKRSTCSPSDAHLPRRQFNHLRCHCTPCLGGSRRAAGLLARDRLRPPVRQHGRQQMGSPREPHRRSGAGARRILLAGRCARLPRSARTDEHGTQVRTRERQCAAIPAHQDSRAGGVLREAAVSVSGETEAGSAVFVKGEVGERRQERPLLLHASGD